MQKFNFSLIILFLLLVNCTFSQISPEKIFYKSTEQTDLNLFIYNPVDFDKSQTYNCIVFFHGGGWNSGDYKQFERQSIYFASRGMVAISVEYRIRNKHGTSPIQAMEDAKSAIRFIRLNACLLYTSPSPRDQRGSRMPSSA